MKIAIEGCCHGELHKIYETLLTAQEKQGIKIDLLICCGDFQAVRNENDLNCMACPVKYRKMQTFHEYYSGDRVAPFLTLFIGGNHEASNHMWELSYGGWVAPNIYYLGNAGVVQYAGLRIAGLSGIYKHNDYIKNHFEIPPYNNWTVRSVYHIRSCDVFKLKQLSGNIDIMLSHDWPEGIYNYGNKDKLLRSKPHFRDDILKRTLGSPPAMELLKLLKPSYWFAAHLHIKFPALYIHEDTNGSKFTKFLSLDKCLPRRSFLQVIDVPVSSEITAPYQLTFDPEWLSIIKSTDHLMSCNDSYWTPPTEDGILALQAAMPATRDVVNTLFKGKWMVPQNFIQSAPLYRKPPKPDVVISPNHNPQTVQFCEMLGIANLFTTKGQSLDHTHTLLTNPDEIQLDDDDDDEVTSPTSLGHACSPVKTPLDDGDPATGGWCIDTAGTPPQTKRPLLSLLPPCHVVPLTSQQLLQAPVMAAYQPAGLDAGGVELDRRTSSQPVGVRISQRNCSMYTGAMEDV